MRLVWKFMQKTKLPWAWVYGSPWEFEDYNSQITEHEFESEVYYTFICESCLTSLDIREMESKLLCDFNLPQSKWLWSKKQMMTNGKMKIGKEKHLSTAGTCSLEPRPETLNMIMNLRLEKQWNLGEHILHLFFFSILNSISLYQ